MADGDDIREGLFKYHHKIKIAKIVFAMGIGTVGFLAGFRIGFGKSKKRSLNAGTDEPFHFAAKALKKATFITLGCFTLCTGVVCMVTGVSSPSDLRNLSRRKWLNKANSENTDMDPGTNQEITFPIVEKNEILIDRASDISDS